MSRFERTGDGNGGNPNPTAGNNPDEYADIDCPQCGATVKNLPKHLRHNCEANHE